MDLEQEVDAAALAQLLGLTSRRIHQLCDEGVIARGKGSKRGKFPLRDSVLGYMRHLRAQLPKGPGNDALTTERARLAKEQADKAAMQNAVTRRELAPVAVIEQVIARCAAHAADVLDGIPVALKREVPDIDMRVIRIVEREVAKARTIAADAKLELPEET